MKADVWNEPADIRADDVPEPQVLDPQEGMLQDKGPVRMRADSPIPDRPSNADERKVLQAFFSEYSMMRAKMIGLELLFQKQPGLLTGDHYWRSISENGIDFDLPTEIGTHLTDVAAWSRIEDNREFLCAINLHREKEAVVYVTVDDVLHASGSKMMCLYDSEPSPRELNVENRNGKCIRLTIPPRGLVIYS